MNMRFHTAFRPCRLAVLCAALTLGGCALPLTHPSASVDLPLTWSEATANARLDVELDTQWWRGFHSGELEQLVEQSLAGSPDLAVATERVLQAEIATRSAGATLFPTVNLNLNTGLSGTNGAGIATTRSEASSASLGVSYEIDVWGSNIARLQGSRATLAATRYDYEATRLSLVAGVSSAYAQVLAQRARLTIARENLAIAERLFAIVEARYRNGAASALDVSRQRSTVLSQRDAIVPLETTERQLLRALAILVGSVPQGFDVKADTLALAIPEPGMVLPAELLLRRPDLAAAEARLQAADADIAVARAALFPLKLNLGISSALSSGEFGLVELSNPLNTANLTVSLLKSIFDGGRLRGAVETTESQRRASVETYRKTILTALKEVEDAIATVERGRIQEATQQAIKAEAERALRLSELRYREGSDTLSTLLDAQRSLFSVQDTLVQQRLTRINAAVDLYKVLGGGWQLSQTDVSATTPQ